MEVRETGCRGLVRSITLLGLALAALAVPAVARAGTITPTDGVDEFNSNASHCSLREAITAAQTSGTFNGCVVTGGDQNSDTISLVSGVTYTLSLTGSPENANASGDLDIVGQSGDDQLSITTTSSARATIDGNGAVTADRVFEVGPGLYPVGYVADFSLNNVEIKGGNPGSLSDAGGIKVSDVTAFHLSSAYVHGNSSGGGGGIRLDSANASITDSRIEGNTSTAGFGGLWIESSDATISGTTISGNHAQGGSGGGIAISSNPFPDVTLTNSTVSGNDASTDGGGISSTADPAAGNPGSLTIASSTIAGNTADSDSNGSGDGGGIFTYSPASTSARNSIFGDNVDTGGQAPDCGGTLVSQGYNLFESTAGCSLTGGTGDLTGVDPKLGTPTIDAGGVPVPVIPLLPGSPALNAGNPGTADGTPPHCPTADQRAFSRGSAFVDACDIGAYEVQDHDPDGDKYWNAVDNCDNNANPGQEDLDSDGLGDVCDPDDDNDGVADASDNCAVVANADQANADGDSQGDACDPDDDNDGVVDASDNCQVVANADQADADGDSLGDVCDPDDDNDTVADAGDNCPSVINTNQANADGDSQGDVCDPDDDNDGVLDAADNCPVQAGVSSNAGCPAPAVGGPGTTTPPKKKCKKKKSRAAVAKKCKKKK